MPKWVNDEVLQKYFVERHEKYTFKGQRIIDWKTSDFDQDIELLRNAQYLW
ncbi:MAG: hypothetical protein ABSD49_11075 [Candidatus Bathyarchaeia archaeon]|jgi:hypothetical protein